MRDSVGPVQLYFLPVFSSLIGGSTTAGTPAFALSAFGPLGLAMPTAANTFEVGADSGAGQLRKSMFQQGLLPYAPHAHLDPGRAPVVNPGASEPDPFGFEIGRRYTIRWPPPGQRTNDLEGRCEGDIYDPDAGELFFDPPMGGGGTGLY